MSEPSNSSIVECIRKALRQLQSSDSQLTELQLPQNVFDEAHKLVEAAVFQYRYFERGYFSHILILADTVTLDRAVSEVKAWQEGLKAIIRYPLNLLLSPNRPELNRVKLSTSHFVHRVEKKLKNALKILQIMGYAQIQGSNDLVLHKNTQEHLLKTVSDLTVLHEELAIVLFVLDRVTKMYKQDGTLAKLSEVLIARQRGLPSRMKTLEMVMTSEISNQPPVIHKPALDGCRQDSQYPVSTGYDRPQHDTNSPSHYTPVSYGQPQYGSNQYQRGPNSSRYQAQQYAPEYGVNSSRQPRFGWQSEVSTDCVPLNTGRSMSPSHYPTNSQFSHVQHSSPRGSPIYSPSHSPHHYLTDPSESSQHSDRSRSPPFNSNQYRQPPGNVIARSSCDPPATSTPMQPPRERLDSMSPSPEDLPPPIFENEDQLKQLFRDKNYPSWSMGDISPTESLMHSKIVPNEHSSGSLPESLPRTSSNQSTSSIKSQSSFTKKQYQPFGPTKPTKFSIGSIDEEDQCRQYDSTTSSSSVFKHTNSVGSHLSDMGSRDNEVQFDGTAGKPKANRTYVNVPIMPEPICIASFPRRKSSNDVSQYPQEPVQSKQTSKTLDCIDTYQKTRDYEVARRPDYWEKRRVPDNYTQSGAAATTGPSYTRQPPTQPYSSAPSRRPPQSSYQTYMEPQRTQTDSPGQFWTCPYCMQRNPVGVPMCVVCNESTKL